MTKREWKPGDVAMVTDFEDCERLAVRGENISGPCWWFPDARTWITTSAARPLVVIDPEDRREVARLEAIYDKVLREAAKRDDIVDVLQATLREFTDPSAVEEPTGLGAVVRDRSGNEWVRVTDTTHPWVRAHREKNSYTHRTYWACVDAVEVLSEGVQS